VTRGRSDPQLVPIAAKVERGERLTREDGLALFASADLLTVGRLADVANRRKNRDRVYFAANQHINPTNVCILRNTCVFCSFARMPKEDGSYTRSLDEVFAEADAARENPTREFHIVGGLHPKLELSYYLDMFRGLKQRHPNVMIKALTAVEVAHLARIEGMTTRDVLLAMKDAGVSTLPGGGAEVFSPAARAYRTLIALRDMAFIATNVVLYSVSAALIYLPIVRLFTSKGSGAAEAYGSDFVATLYANHQFKYNFDLLQALRRIDQLMAACGDLWFLPQSRMHLVTAAVVLLALVMANVARQGGNARLKVVSWTSEGTVAIFVVAGCFVMAASPILAAA